MKIQNIQNTEKLFEIIDSCTGKVELVCEDMRLNLKSTLTQFISLATIFSGGTDIAEFEIIAYNQEDVNKLMQFMLDGCK